MIYIHVVNLVGKEWPFTSCIIIFYSLLDQNLKKKKTFCMMSFCMKVISNLRNLIVTLKMPELCYNLAFTFSVNECVHFESCIFPLQHNEDSPVEWQGLYFHMWSILYAINCLVMVRPLLKLHNWSFRPTESCRVCS